MKEIIKDMLKFLAGIVSLLTLMAVAGIFFAIGSTIASMYIPDHSVVHILIMVSAFAIILALVAVIKVKEGVKDNEKEIEKLKKLINEDLED